jgi:putative MFS transporter
MKDDCETAVLIEENKTKESNNLNSSKMFLDNFFSHIKFTQSHFFLITSIFLIRTFEATEVFCLSVSSPMIEKDFNLPENSSSYINVIILSGNLIGCLFSMWISDRYPRKYLITLGVILMIIFSFISIFSHNIVYFYIFRHIANIGCGMIPPGSMALVSESMNLKYRGFILNFILVSGALGEAFISFCLGGVVKFEDPHEWRKLFLITTTPVKYFLYKRLF